MEDARRVGACNLPIGPGGDRRNRIVEIHSIERIELRVRGGSYSAICDRDPQRFWLLVSAGGNFSGNSSLRTAQGLHADRPNCGLRIRLGTVFLVGRHDGRTDAARLPAFYSGPGHPILARSRNTGSPVWSAA